jgi:hypothetical protein
LAGKTKYSEKTCPITTFPPQISHDLTWNRAQAAGANRLSYGTARFHSIAQTPEFHNNIPDLFIGTASISEYIGSIVDDQ